MRPASGLQSTTNSVPVTSMAKGPVHHAEPRLAVLERDDRPAATSRHHVERGARAERHLRPIREPDAGRLAGRSGADAGASDGGLAGHQIRHRRQILKERDGGDRGHRHPAHHAEPVAAATAAGTRRQQPREVRERRRPRQELALEDQVGAPPHATLALAFLGAPAIGIFSRSSRGAHHARPSGREDPGPERSAPSSSPGASR